MIPPWCPWNRSYQNDSPSGVMSGNLENAELRCSGSGTHCCPASFPRSSGQREHPRLPEPQSRQRQKQTREKQGRSGVLTCVPSFSFTARCCRFEYASNVFAFSTYLAVFGSGFPFSCRCPFILKTSLSTRPRLNTIKLNNVLRWRIP